MNQTIANRDEIITKREFAEKIVRYFGTIKKYELFCKEWAEECERIRKQFGYK